MRKPIKMPTLSDTMETGRLHQWLKQPGDRVKKGEVIAEVESDKAVMEVEAFSEGYLAEPLAAPESDIPVGTVIGYLTDRIEETVDSQAAAEAPPSSATPKQEVDETPTPAVAEPPSSDEPPAKVSHPSAGERTPVSPYARGLARDLGLSLTTVPPGPDGVVHAAQVLAAALAGPQPQLEAGPPYRYKLFTPMHRAVAENMSATLATPTFRVSSQLDLGAFQAHAHERKLSLSLLLARACALAVGAHPHFNAVYTPRGLAVRERVDVGIAVDIPGGLVTPVLRDAGVRPLDELAEEWRALKEKVKRGRLQPEDYEGATFYFSNLGIFPGVTRFEAIVPLGAAAILAVGAAHAGLTDFTLSCDHRVVFGADGAHFLASLGELLAAPATL